MTDWTKAGAYHMDRAGWAKLIARHNAEGMADWNKFFSERFDRNQQAHRRNPD